MGSKNEEVVAVFNEIADLLEIEGDNPFRIRAYRNAARTIQSLPQSVSAYVTRGLPLTDLDGIGKELAAKITEIVSTGHSQFLKKLRKRVPSGVVDMLAIQSLGPKRVAALYHDLKVTNLKKLKSAARSGKIQKLAGFGPKITQAILEDMDRVQSPEFKRMPIRLAEGLADNFVRHLKKNAPGIRDVAVMGSFRRRVETVGDIDILATATSPGAAMDAFTRYEEVRSIISRGSTRASVKLHSGAQVDIRIVPRKSLGAAMLYFTGSKEHNIALRKLAIKKKLKINEYGVFKGSKRVGGRTEREIYKILGLPFIPPEIREGGDELAAARADTLPKLIKLDDIRGDLHIHTTRSDGQSTLDEIIKAAIDIGYAYIGITEHSQRVTFAGGLKEKELLAYIKSIDRLNKKYPNIRILKSAEVDILEDGTLDYSNDVLKALDFTICSIHHKFRLPKDVQTERIIRAMDNPYFNILGHPTGRLILGRAPYDVDMERLIQEAAERGCIFELNAQPDRLDLNDTYCRMAKGAGLKIAISTDAHSAFNLAFMRYGVDQARRGWLSAADVINTRPLAQLRKAFRR